MKIESFKFETEAACNYADLFFMDMETLKGLLAKAVANIETIVSEKEETKEDKKKKRRERFDAQYLSGKTNPIILNYEEFAGGLLCHVKNAAGTEVFARQKQAVCSLLMETLDERVQSVGFKFTADDGKALQAGTSTALDQLSSFSLIEMEIIAFNNKNRLTALGLGIDGKGSTQDYQTFRHFVIRKMDKETVLWIPTKGDGKNRTVDFPLLLVDIKDEEVYYDFADGKQKELKRGEIACYQWKNNASVQIVNGPKQRSGVGGGAMRSDKIDEVAYRWAGSKALGCALGLDLEAYLGRAVKQIPEGFTETPTPETSEIRYFKKFLNPYKQKRNEPKFTVPLDPLQFRKLADFSDNWPNSNASQLDAKKKKGNFDFLFSCWTGENLKHKNTERQSAGKVMKEALAERGVPNNVKAGSATAFTTWVLETDKSAKASWAQVSSKKVALYKQYESNQKQNVLTEKQATIRTEQEWCHLFGHGDGGNEDYGNFISGSKHCNTEQLAIESAQRYNKYKDLTAKVTAYLFPNGGFPKQKFTDADRAFFQNFNLPKNFSDVALAQLLDQFIQAKSDFAKLLLEQDPSNSVPSKSLYQMLPETEQKRLRDRVVDQLNDILHPRYPLGAFVRYKLYNGGAQLLDHKFYAQKESFDLNEYKILETTVKRLVAVSMGDGDDYKNAVNAKISVLGKVKEAGTYKLPSKKKK